MALATGPVTLPTNGGCLWDGADARHLIVGRDIIDLRQRQGNFGKCVVHFGSFARTRSLLGNRGQIAFLEAGI